jgi:hypothetical protein
MRVVRAVVILFIWIFLLLSQNSCSLKGQIVLNTDGLVMPNINEQTPVSTDAQIPVNTGASQSNEQSTQK